jgi:hypothetical protein
VSSGEWWGCLLTAGIAGSALIQACEKAGSVVPRYAIIQLIYVALADLN